MAADFGCAPWHERSKSRCVVARVVGALLFEGEAARTGLIYRWRAVSRRFVKTREGQLYAASITENPTHRCGYRLYSTHLGMYCKQPSK
jgi:hypothetical protein